MQDPLIAMLSACFSSNSDWMVHKELLPRIYKSFSVELYLKLVPPNLLNFNPFNVLQILFNE